MPTIVQPIFDPNRGYREWLIAEVYTGPEGPGAFVPNVNDKVFDWETGDYRVIAVDSTTGLSTRVPWALPSSSVDATDDALLGVGPGYQSETFRALVDTSVTPHTLRIDSRLHAYGNDVTHYKLFRGTDVTSNNAQVISAYYDNSNTFISENIPVGLAATVDQTNTAVNAPLPGWVTVTLADGEPVTAVFYYGSGKVSSINVLLAKRTTLIRSSEASQRYITRIAVDSPFVSQTEENTLEFPMNLPINALVAFGRVTYSNGDVRRVPIDGTKMVLSGLENYVSTIQGQRAPLLLRYNLAVNESAEYVQGTGTNRYIAQSWYARTTAVQGAYSVKLFVLPRWVDEATGWSLDYYLYNLDRDDVFFATPFVEQGANSAAFLPKWYGAEQNLTVALDLNRVDSRLAAYRHVQTFRITLFGNGLEDRTPWLIGYSPNGPEYGQNLKAALQLVSIGEWRLNIASGYTELTEWLNDVYWRSEPLYNIQTETRAPQPTHFVVNLNGFRNEWPITDWNTVLTSTTGGQIGGACIIEWVRKVGGDTLQLGCSPFVIVHV